MGIATIVFGWVVCFVLTYIYITSADILVASIADRYGVSRATIYKHAGADAPARH